MAGHEAVIIPTWHKLRDDFRCLLVISILWDCYARSLDIPVTEWTSSWLRLSLCGLRKGKLYVLSVSLTLDLDVQQALRDFRLAQWHQLLVVSDFHERGHERRKVWYGYMSTVILLSGIILLDSCWAIRRIPKFGNRGLSWKLYSMIDSGELWKISSTRKSTKSIRLEWRYLV